MSTRWWDWFWMGAGVPYAGYVPVDYVTPWAAENEPQAAGWSDEDSAEDPSWSPGNDAQTAGWTDEDDAQDPGWTPRTLTEDG